MPTLAVVRRRLVLALVLVLAGCGGSSSPPPSRGVAVPDGGVSAGHADEPRRVRVPEVDRTAPSATLTLARVSSPVLRAVAVGRDKQGMARIRVSLEARLRCGASDVPLIRYFPPPETARPRIPPGVLAPTELTRRVRYAFRCPSGGLQAVRGTLWADATSAWETEASSAPVRFSWRRG